MRTSDLQGAQLNLWCARAEGWTRDLIVPFQWHHKTNGLYSLEDGLQFSSDWALGGPIIERERITLTWLEHQWFAELAQDRIVVAAPYFSGSTALEAAMRAYVDSKFGSEVDEAPPIALP